MLMSLVLWASLHWWGHLWWRTYSWCCHVLLISNKHIRHTHFRHSTLLVTKKELCMPYNVDIRWIIICCILWMKNGKIQDFWQNLHFWRTNNDILAAQSFGAYHKHTRHQQVMTWWPIYVICILAHLGQLTAWGQNNYAVWKRQAASTSPNNTCTVTTNYFLI